MSTDVQTQTQFNPPAEFNEEKYKQVCARRKLLRQKIGTLSALEKAEFVFLDELVVQMKHDRYYWSKRNNISTRKKAIYCDRALAQYKFYLSRLNQESPDARFGSRSRLQEISRVQRLITKNENKVSQTNKL
jgi:hypothetical protein